MSGAGGRTGVAITRASHSQPAGAEHSDAEFDVASVSCRTRMTTACRRAGRASAQIDHPRSRQLSRKLVRDEAGIETGSTGSQRGSIVTSAAEARSRSGAGGGASTPLIICNTRRQCYFFRRPKTISAFLVFVPFRSGTRKLGRGRSDQLNTMNSQSKKGKGSPYSITVRRHTHTGPTILPGPLK